MNECRHTIADNTKATYEKPSISVRQTQPLSAAMMQLLEEALGDFDEPCSRVGLVHGRDPSQPTIIDQQPTNNAMMKNAAAQVGISTTSALVQLWGTDAASLQQKDADAGPEAPTSETSEQPTGGTSVNMMPTSDAPSFSPFCTLDMATDLTTMLSVVATSKTRSESVSMNPVNMMPTSDEAPDPTTWSIADNQYTIPQVTPLIIYYGRASMILQLVYILYPGRPPGTVAT